MGSISERSSDTGGNESGGNSKMLLMISLMLRWTSEVVGKGLSDGHGAGAGGVRRRRS